MKQAVQNLQNGKTELLEVPVPGVRPGCLLVRTAASVVSVGTERSVVDFAGRSLIGKARSRPDLVRRMMEKAGREGVVAAWEAATTRLSQPMALGYAASGTVVAIGDGVKNFRIGDRVACAGGGHAVHAEFISVPVNLACKIPAAVSLEDAAFTTLGAIALHGFRLSHAALGETVAVIGLGLLGQLSVQIAAAAGCRVFGIDLEPERVKLAERMGAHGASPRRGCERPALAFTGGRGFDAVLICADTAADDPVTLAGELSRDRGRVVAVGAVGTHLPRKTYYEREVEFIISRSYGPGRYDEQYEEAGVDYPFGYVRWTENRNLGAFLSLLAAKHVKVSLLITHRFTMDQAVQAYRAISGKRKAAGLLIGVVLTYSGESKPETSVHIPMRGSLPSSGLERIRLGVLGAGNFAMAVALPVITRAPDVEKVCIASGGGLSARQAADRFRFARAASRSEDVLADTGIDAVGIFTRHNLHARQAAAALRSGKHVFCEKPLALNERELKDVEMAWKANPSRILMVGFNRRFAPMALRLRSQIAALGEPPVIVVRVNGGQLPAGHWVNDPAQGGGRILGEACHFVDLIGYLAGSLPVSACAVNATALGENREDNFAAVLECANGAVGTLVYSAAGDRASGKERVEIFCGGVTMVLDDFFRLEIWQGGSRRSWTSRFRQDKGHRAVWEAFLRAIRDGGRPPIPAEEIFGVTRATFGLLRAVREGRPVRWGEETS